MHQRVDRDDGGREVGERVQQFPHGGDLIAFLVGGDLAEDHAEAVRERRDQVRGLTVLVLRAADRLAFDRDDDPAADLNGPGVQPGA